MERIVVGVDGSEVSLEALRWAQGVAGTETTVHAVLTWVYPVVSGAGMDLGGVSYAMPVEGFEELAQERLDEALEAVPAGDVTRTGETVMSGSESAGLVDAAADADLLVVGSRGHSRFERLLVGSVAIQCAQHAECPFVAVPAGAPPLEGTIVAAYDDSDTSKAALRWASGVAAERGLDLRVVAVWSPRGWAEANADHAAMDQRDLERLGAQVADVLGDAAAAADIRLVYSDENVVPQVLANANDASMIVVGSRGRGGFTGLLLGSVSQRFLESSPLPVAVIRD